MKNVNIGTVGFGAIAKTHALACCAMQIMYTDLPFRPVLKTVVRRSNDSQSDIFLNTVNSLEELLADDTIQLVDICTPNHLHGSQARQAIAAGRAVYCEKPLGINYWEAQQLADLAEKHSVINQVALVYRFMPAVVMAREYILRGGIGDIIHFRFGLYHKGYLNADRPLSWRMQKKYSGGGAIIDLGIHLADLVQFLLGEIEQVQAYLKTYHHKRPLNNASGATGEVDVDDYAKLEVELRQKAAGMIECSRVASMLHEGLIIEIYGSQGSITVKSCDPYYPQVHKHDQNVTVTGDLFQDSPFSKHIQKIYPQEKISLGLITDLHLASLYHLFLNTLNGKIQYAETPTFHEAAAAQKVVEAGLISHQEEHRWVKLDEKSL